MRRSLKMAGSLALIILLTAGAAWAGQRWIAGFDIRGPFLVMSPLFAVSLFFWIASFKVLQPEEEKGTPKASDAALIQATALEYGFGPVSVIQQRHGKELSLAMRSAIEETFRLPKNWDKLDVDARRFAVIRALAGSNAPWYKRFVARMPWYSALVAAMLIAGYNLWLILACHLAGAAAFAHKVFWRREWMLTYADIQALRVMKNLKAAIAFVRSDPSGAEMDIRPDRRIAALKREAARMGIA